MQEQLVPLIAAVAREVGAQQQIELDAALDRDTQLYGPGGILDSMALVALVIAVEQAIEERFGVAVGLADEKALSQRHSPFRTIGTLAEYAARELQARKGDG